MCENFASFETSFDSGISLDSPFENERKLLKEYARILYVLERDKNLRDVQREKLNKVAERKPKRKNTDRCNVCFDILDLEDFKSCATCCNCGKSVCRGRKCSVWLPSQAGWECQLCNSSNESRSRASEWVHRQHIDQYYRPMSAAKSELYIPIRDRNGGSRLSVYETQSETASTICAEQKEKVREYVEEILAKMLKGPLDEVSVGQLYKNKEYLPLTGSQSDYEGVSHAKLKRLIEKIIEDVLHLPELTDYSGVPGHSEENLPPYFDAKRYQELLATAVLNKIVDSYNNEKKFDNTTEKTSNTDLDKNHNTVTNKKEQQDYSSSSSIEPRSDSSLTDNIRRSNLISPSDSCENIIQSDELLLSDYLNKHKVPLPDLSVDSESASDDYISIATSNGVEGSWEDNWLFKKKKHNHESPAPIGMLVPAPREDVRALIGDKTADEVSDLSEAGSDSEGEDCRMNNAEPDLNPPNERVLNKHVIGGKSTVGLFDELLEHTSLISSSSLQDNEPPYTETKNDFVLGDDGLYEIAEPNINLFRGNVPIKNEAVNSMITAQILQPSPTKGIFEPTPTENFDETIIFAPPMEFTDDPKNTFNEINGNDDTVSDSTIKSEIYGDSFAESPTNELSGAQIITCGEQMLTATTTNNINKLTIEMPCDKQKVVISKMNSVVSEGDTPYHTPPSNTPPEENQNNFSCEAKVVRKSSAIEFLAVVALAPVLALSTAEVNDTILKVTEESPTYEAFDLELLKENYCENVDVNKGQDSFVKQETEADNFEAVNKVSEISENDNSAKQRHQKENETEHLSSKVDGKTGKPDESGRGMNVQKFTVEDEKISNIFAEDPKKKIIESISEDIETLSNKVHIQSSQEILRKENTPTETSTIQSEIPLIENEGIGIYAIKCNEQILSKVQKSKTNTDKQYSTSVGGAVTKEETKSTQNNTFATTTAGAAQSVSSPKEFASVAVGLENREAFPISEDKTTPLRSTSKVYITIEGNETLVDNVTKPIDSASVTNFQFSEDCAPPADDALAKDIITQRKETAVKNVTEPQNTISDTSTTKDARSQESPKEAVSETESSETEKDSTAPSETKVEKSTPVEPRESPLQNVTEAIKPQNNISVASTANDNKLKESSKKFVIVTASSETTTTVSIPQDCTPLSETKIEENTAIEETESSIEQAIPQNFISNTTTAKDAKPEEFPNESDPVTENSETTLSITEDSTAPSETAVKGSIQTEEEEILLPLQNVAESIKLQNKNSLTNTSDDAESEASLKESVSVAENSEINTTISFLEDFSTPSQTKIAKSKLIEAQETPSENGTEPVTPQNNISDTTIMGDAKANESPKEVVVNSENKTVVSIIEDRAPPSETKVQENIPVVAKKALLKNVKEKVAHDNDISDTTTADEAKAKIFPKQSVSFTENSHTKTILSIPEDSTAPPDTKVEESTPVETKENPLKNSTEPAALQNNISNKTIPDNVKVEEAPNVSGSATKSSETKTDVSIPEDSTAPSQTKVEKNKTVEAKEIPLDHATEKTAPHNDISDTTTIDDVKAEESLKKSVSAVECSETKAAVSIPADSAAPSETNVEERTTLANVTEPVTLQHNVSDTLITSNTKAEEFLKIYVSVEENSETKTPVSISEDSTVFSKAQVEESIAAETKETLLENVIELTAPQKDISDETIKDDSKVEEFAKESVSVVQASENKTAVSTPIDISTASDTKVEKCIPVEANETSLENATVPTAAKNVISDTTSDDTKTGESLKESVSVVECSETKTAVSIPKDSTNPSDTKEEKNTLIEAKEMPLENAAEPAATQIATADDVKVEESPKESLSFVQSFERAVSTSEDNATPSQDKVDVRTPAKAKETPLKNVTEPPPLQNDISYTITTFDVKAEESTKESVSVLESLETKTFVTIPEDSTAPSKTKLEENMPAEAKETTIEDVSESAAGQNEISDTTTTNDAETEESPRESVSVVKCSESQTIVSIPENSTTPSESKIEESTLAKAKETQSENHTEPAVPQNNNFDTTTTADYKGEKSLKKVEESSEITTTVVIPRDSNASSETKVEERTPVKAKEASLENATEPSALEDNICDTTTTDDTKAKESPKEYVSNLENSGTATAVSVPIDSTVPLETKVEVSIRVESKETPFKNVAATPALQNNISNTTTTDDVKTEEYPKRSASFAENSETKILNTILGHSTISSETAVEENTPIKAKGTALRNTTEPAAPQNDISDRTTMGDATSEESPKESVSVIDNSETKANVLITGNSTDSSETTAEGNTPVDAKETSLENATDSAPNQSYTFNTTTMDDSKAEKFSRESVPVVDNSEKETAFSISEKGTVPSKIAVEDSALVEAKETLLENATNAAIENATVSVVERTETETPVRIPEDSTSLPENKVEKSTPVEAKETPFENATKSATTQNANTDAAKAEVYPKQFVPVAESSETKTAVLIPRDSIDFSKSKVEESIPVEAKETSLEIATERQNEISDTTSTDNAKANGSPKKSVSVVECSERRIDVSIPEDSTAASETKVEESTPVKAKEPQLEKVAEPGAPQNYNFKITTTDDSKNSKAKKSPKQVIDSSETKITIAIPRDSNASLETKILESTLVEVKETPLENGTEPFTPEDNICDTTTTDDVKAKESPKEPGPNVESSGSTAVVPIPENSTVLSETKVEKDTPAEANDTALKIVKDPPALQNDISDTTSTDNAKAEEPPQKSVSVVEKSETTTAVSITEVGNVPSEIKAEESTLVKTKETSLVNVTEPAETQNDIFDMTNTDDTKAEELPKIVSVSENSTVLSDSENIAENIFVEAVETPLENATNPVAPLNDNSDKTTADDTNSEKSAKEYLSIVKSSETKAPANCAVPSETKVEKSLSVEAKETLQSDTSDTTIPDDSKTDESAKQSLPVVICSETKTTVSLPEDTTATSETNVDESTPVRAKETPLENATESVTPQNDISDTTTTGDAKAKKSPKEVEEGPEIGTTVAIPQDNNYPSERLEKVTEPAASENYISNTTTAGDAKVEESPNESGSVVKSSETSTSVSVPEDDTGSSETMVEKSTAVEVETDIFESVTAKSAPQKDVSDTTTTGYGKTDEFSKELIESSETKTTVAIPQDSYAPSETSVGKNTPIQAKETPLENATEPSAPQNDISDKTITDDARAKESRKEVAESSETKTTVAIPQDSHAPSESKVEKSISVESTETPLENMTVLTALQSDTSDTTTPDDAKTEESPKESLSVVIFSETKTTVSLPEDTTATSETNVEESTPVRAKETLLENATKPVAPQNDISDTTTTDEEGPEIRKIVAIPQDSNSPLETTVEGSISLEAKETPLEKATEPIASEDDISNTTITGDAKVEESPKESGSVVESSETSTSISVPEDGTGSSETMVEKNTAVEVEKDIFESVTAKSAPQKDVSDTTTTGYGKTEEFSKEPIESSETKTTVAIPQDNNALSETKVGESTAAQAKETPLENAIESSAPQNDISEDTITDDAKAKESSKAVIENSETKSTVPISPMESVSVATGSEIKTTDTILEYSTTYLETAKEENTPVEVKGTVLDNTTKTPASQSDISDRTAAVDATSGEYPKESVSVLENSEARTTVSITGNNTDPSETTVEGSTPVEAKETSSEKAKVSAATQNHTSDTTAGDDCKADKSPKESVSLVYSSENKTAVSIPEIHTVPSKTEVEEGTPVEAQETPLENATEPAAIEKAATDDAKAEESAKDSVSIVESSKTKTFVSIPEGSTISSEIKVEESASVQTKVTLTENLTKPAKTQNDISNTTTAGDTKPEESPKEVEESSKAKIVVLILEDSTVSLETKVEESTPVEAKETTFENVTELASPHSNDSDKTTTDKAKAAESIKECVLIVENSETKAIVSIPKDCTVLSEFELEESTPVEVNETPLKIIIQTAPPQNDTYDATTADEAKTEGSAKESMSVVKFSETNTAHSVPEGSAVPSESKVEESTLVKAKETPIENVTESAESKNDISDTITTDETMVEESLKEVVECSKAKTIVSDPEDCTINSETKVAKSIPVKAKETPFENVTEQVALQNDIFDTTTTEEARAKESPKESVSIVESSEIEITVSNPDGSTFSSDSKVEKSVLLETKETLLENATVPSESKEEENTSLERKENSYAEIKEIALENSAELAEPQTAISDTTSTDDAETEESPRKVVASSEITTAVSIREDSIVPSATKVEDSKPVEAKETPLENETEPAARQNNISSATATDDAKPDKSPRELVETLEANTADLIPEDSTAPSKTQFVKRTHVEAKETPLENATDLAATQNNISDRTTTRDARAEVSLKESVPIAECSKTKPATPVPKDTTVPNIEENRPAETKETPLENVTEPATPQNIVSDATATDDAKAGESPEKESSETNAADSIPKESAAALETKVEESSPIEAKETPYTISGATATDDSKPDESPKEVVKTLEANTTDLIPEDSSAPSEIKVENSTHLKAKETTLENATEPVVPDTTTPDDANSERSPKEAVENSEAKTTVAIPQDNNVPSETIVEESTPVERKENRSKPVAPPSDMSDTMHEIKAEVSPKDFVSIVKSSEAKTAVSVMKDERTDYTKAEKSLKEIVKISETQTAVLITNNAALSETKIKITPAEATETLLGKATEPTGSQNEVYDTSTTDNAKTVESPMDVVESSGTKLAISVPEDNTSFSESKGKKATPVDGEEAPLVDVTEHTAPLNAISDTITADSAKSEESSKVVVTVAENSKNKTAVSIPKEYNASSETLEKANSVAEEKVCSLENVAEPIALQNNISGKTAADGARSEKSPQESISGVTFLETKTVISIQKDCAAPSENTIKGSVVIESSETKADVSISEDSTFPSKTATEEVSAAMEGVESPIENITETVESQKAVSQATSNDSAKSEESGEKSLLATEYSTVKVDFQIIEPIIFSDETDIKKAITAVKEKPSKELKLASSVNLVSKTTTNDNAKPEVPQEESVSAVGSSEITSETTIEEDSAVVEGKETQLVNVTQLIALSNIISQETTKDNVEVVEEFRIPLENAPIMETKRQLLSDNILQITSDLENQINIQIAEKISTLEIVTDSQAPNETPIVEPTIVTMETETLTGYVQDAPTPSEDAQDTSILSENIQNRIYKESKVDAIADKLCQGTCDTMDKDLNESTIILSATKILESNVYAQQSEVNSTILQASSAKQEALAVICETVQKSESSKSTDACNDKISENDITTNEIPEQIDPNTNQIENCEITIEITEPPATDRSSLESNTTDGSSTTVIERSETSPEPLLSNDKIEANTNKPISAITNHTNTAPNSILNTNAPSSDILINSDVEKDALPKPTLGEDEIERPLKHLIPGSIAEREHKKWYNAVEMPNNPYAPEALIRRLSDGPEKPIDIPNITPVLEKTNEEAEKVCENPLPVGLEVEKPDYKRYSRDYYINDSKHASGSRISSSKSSEINLIGQDAGAGNDKEPTTSSTTPPPYSQHLVSSNCSADKKTDNFGDIFLAKPVRVEESDPILNKATKLEYLSTPDRDFYLLPSEEAGNLRRSITPSDHTSTQTIDSLTASEDSDTIRIYDLNKQETRLIKDETLETSSNTPIRPTVLSLAAPKGPTPTRVVTPTSLRFLQPKRKLFDPKLIMSDDTDKSFTIMDGDVVQTPTNGLTEKPVIEQEVASSLPSVKALAKAYLLASSKASNVTLNRSKSPTSDLKTSLTSDVKTSTTPTTPTALISTLELSDDRTVIASTVSGNEPDQPQSPVIEPSSDSYSPPYDQKYSPLSPTTNKSLNLEIVTNNTESENTMIETVFRPERPISPVVQPGQLRNSIAFFENLRNK